MEGEVAINGYGKKSAVCIASQPATTFTGGCASRKWCSRKSWRGESLRRLVVSASTGSGVSRSVLEAELLTVAQVGIGGGAGHGRQGGDAKLAAESNVREAQEQ